MRKTRGQMGTTLIDTIITMGVLVVTLGGMAMMVLTTQNSATAMRDRDMVRAQAVKFVVTGGTGISLMSLRMPDGASGSRTRPDESRRSPASRSARHVLYSAANASTHGSCRSPEELGDETAATRVATAEARPNHAHPRFRAPPFLMGLPAARRRREVFAVAGAVTADPGFTEHEGSAP